MAEIKNAHIFNVGTWNGITITPEILDSLVSSFSVLAQSGRVPLKFGHNDEQSITDGQPAIGWVSRVWREGGKLLADFTGMPAVVFDAIKQGLYKFVSIEMLRDVECNGSKWPAVLDAVAVLGADRPAVGVLADLQGLIPMSRAIPSMRVGSTAAFKQSFSYQSNGDRKHMADDNVTTAINAALAPVNAELAKVRQDFSAQTEALRKAEADNAALKAQVEAQAKTERDARIASNKERFTVHVNALIKAQMLTPARRDEFIKLNLKDDAAYEKLDFSQVAFVLGKIEDIKVQNRDDFSSRNHSRDDVDVAAEVAKRVAEMVASRPGMDVFSAHTAVFRLDRALGDAFIAHLNVTGHERGQPINVLGN